MSNDSDGLIATIEDRQEEAYAKAGELLGFGPDATRAWEYLTGKDATADPKATYGIPTRFEHPVYYNLLSGIASELQASMGDKTPEPPAIVATMPTGSVNAMLRPPDPDSGVRTIFIEQGLLQFLVDFSNALGWAMPPLGVETLLDDEALATVLSAHPSYTMPYEAPGNFAGVINAYVLSGTPIGAGVGLPFPPHNQDLVVTIHLLILRFIVAHELGHLASKHDGSKPKYEFAADDFGASLSARVLHDDEQVGGGIAAALWSADLALSCLKLLHDGMGYVAFGPYFSWISKTHPDETSRRDALRGTIGALEGTRLSTTTVTAFKWAIGMSDVTMALLGNAALAVMNESHKAGLPPSALWQKHIAKTLAAAPNAVAKG